MLIIKVDKGGLEKAIKTLRRKIRTVKQTNMLRENKHFTKPSVKKRLQKQKAAYIQKLNDDNEQ